MSKLQTLRAVVTKRLTAAAEDIFALFERTIAEYEEELRHFKDSNQKQQLHDINRSIVPLPVPSPGPGPSLSQDITEGTQIKEEQQEEEPLPMFVQETGITVIVKTEESLLLQGQTELKEEPEEKEVSSEPHLRSDTEEQTEESSGSDSEDWKRPLGCSDSLLGTEPDGGYYSQVQTRDKTTASQRSDLSSEHNSAPETSATVKIGDETGTKGDRKKHRCPFCMKRFVTKQGLQSHIRNHTGERPFKCSVCNKSFNQKNHLMRHKLTHTGERPFKCSICEKIFHTKSVLETHKLIHTGEKPFKCPVCNKSFSRRSHLEIHTQTHTGEKPFKCSVCNKSFNQSSNLTRHKRTHTGERPYKCAVCEKTFFDKCVLETHSLIHTGERPFKCSLCEKSFNRKTSLKIHMRIHTGEKPHSCSLCDKRFSGGTGLKKHMKTHQESELKS